MPTRPVQRKTFNGARHRCPHKGCRRVLYNKSGLTQHINREHPPFLFDPSTPPPSRSPSLHSDIQHEHGNPFDRLLDGLAPADLADLTVGMGADDDPRLLRREYHPFLTGIFFFFLPYDWCSFAQEHHAMLLVTLLPHM